MKPDYTWSDRCLLGTTNFDIMQNYGYDPIPSTLVVFNSASRISSKLKHRLILLSIKLCLGQRISSPLLQTLSQNYKKKLSARILGSGWFARAPVYPIFCTTRDHVIRLTRGQPCTAVLQPCHTAPIRDFPNLLHLSSSQFFFLLSAKSSFCTTYEIGPIIILKGDCGWWAHGPNITIGIISLDTVTNYMYVN